MTAAPKHRAVNGHEKYRTKLLAMRAEVDGIHLPLADDAADAGIPGDQADRASQQADIAINIDLTKHEVTLRKEIDDALARLEAGTFATCERCRQHIPAGRLNALPYARFCVACERAHEEQVV